MYPFPATNHNHTYNSFSRTLSPSSKPSSSRVVFKSHNTMLSIKLLSSLQFLTTSEKTKHWFQENISDYIFVHTLMLLMKCNMEFPINIWIVYIFPVNWWNVTWSSHDSGEMMVNFCQLGRQTHINVRIYNLEGTSLPEIESARCGILSSPCTNTKLLCVLIYLNYQFTG